LPTDRELRELMVELGRRLWDRGLIGATEGNLSARLDAHRILCTPRGVCKADLTPEQLVVVESRRQWVSGGEPTSEISMHLAVYELREDVGAVVHAHPPVITGFGIAGETLPTGMLAEADTVLGPVPLVPFARPSSGELATQMRPFVVEHNTFVLAHHGAVAFGSDLREAYDRIETLERCARMLLTARELGQVNRIPEARQVSDAREAAGGK
jgi:L-fuculose-phosphate aldolase